MKYPPEKILFSITAASFFLIFFFTTACNTKMEKNQNQITEASFSPNPQNIEQQEVKTLEIGAKAPDFTLPDVSGEWVSLDDYAESEVLVVVFTCPHCPTAQAYEDRLIAFTREYQSKNVQVVAIMPNSAMGLLPEELGYSDLGDSYEDMQIRARTKSFNFPFLYDGDNHAVSLRYGPTTTPHVFVFDKERKLQYAGNLDQKEKPGTGNAENLRAATDAILAGQAVANPVTKAFGCSVKWAWKQDWAKKVNEEWAEKPVELEEIDAKGVEALVKNTSGKLRLVNVWATWCGPCVIEYPHLVTLQRMYGARDFEFVSISADKPANKEKALSFLKKSSSAIRNYIFSEEDNYQLIEAIDPEWNGALPYTLLIEPEGKVAWKYQGAVDMLQLKQAIVDHPMIGRYY